MTKATKSMFANRVWKILRWPLGLLLLAYIALVIYRVPKVHEERLTAETVAQIHNTKLTLNDVMGKNLPPEPSPQWRDATIAGMDVNHNGIRDDVELAIFQKYPNDPKIRAAELQYALALQKELTMVTNSETLVSAVQEEGRGVECISDTIPNSYSLKQAFAEVTSKKLEVENLVFSPIFRKTQHEQILDKFLTSFSESEEEHCDIDLSTLVG